MRHVVIAFLLVFAACGDPLGPEPAVARYNLVSVDGALPALLWFNPLLGADVIAHSGTLDIGLDWHEERIAIGGSDLVAMGPVERVGHTIRFAPYNTERRVVASTDGDRLTYVYGGRAYVWRLVE